MIEVTAGQAKYEHAYHSIVWRIPRLPKDGQGLRELFIRLKVFFILTHILYFRSLHAAVHDRPPAPLLL